jgi:hypothetical protein
MNIYFSKMKFNFEFNSTSVLIKTKILNKAIILSIIIQNFVLIKTLIY